jgi:hypothetical protein
MCKTAALESTLAGMPFPLEYAAPPECGGGGRGGPVAGVDTPLE